MPSFVPPAVFSVFVAGLAGFNLTYEGGGAFGVIAEMVREAVRLASL